MESKAVFYREGARYVCSNCNSKFFTRDEVTACFNSHKEGEAETEAATAEDGGDGALKEQTSAPLSVSEQPAPSQPAVPSMLVKLEFKQEIIDKLNLLAQKNNTKPAKIIEKIVEKAFNVKAG